MSPDRSNPDRLSLDSPGEFFEINFQASADDRLNFVSMSLISNDWLFAPIGGGVALFDDNGTAMIGDITSQVYLWDAGTEEENPLTFGGGSPELREDDDDNTVRVLEIDVSEYIRAELTNYDDATGTFTLRIYNLRGEFVDTDPIRVSLGVVVVVVVVVQGEEEEDLFFTAGEPERDNGLQLLAERGDFSELLASLTE